MRRKDRSYYRDETYDVRIPALWPVPIHYPKPEKRELYADERRRISLIDAEASVDNCLLDELRCGW
jgi:hypothetical protein